jgi:polysaccharide export outer membrane protein
MTTRSNFRFVLVLAIAGIALADGPLPAPPAAARPAVDPSLYVLKANDEIAVRSLEAKEISDKTYRLDERGQINMPLVGRVTLGGATLPQAERILVESLKSYYRDPSVELSVTSLHSEPISILGSVGTPGVHQIKGNVTLLDALSMAGGAKGDAGPVVIVTRTPENGAIPQPGAKTSPTGESVVEMDLRSLLDSRDPSQNFLLKAHDTISIPPAQVVYVVGNVKHAGGFALGGKPDLSVLQAVALAEGLDPRAAPQRARIVRRNAGTEEQIPIDLKKILTGKSPDVRLLANDILFVPNSSTKAITSRAIDTALTIGTGRLVWR